MDLHSLAVMLLMYAVPYTNVCCHLKNDDDGDDDDGAFDKTVLT